MDLLNEFTDIMLWAGDYPGVMDSGVMIRSYST
jgi:hypothetical protein